MGASVRFFTIQGQRGNKCLLTRARDSEAWRYTGPFTRGKRFKNSFPGFGTATVLFAGYLVYEQLFMKSEHGHADGHGEEHH